mmetsp:Transcript_104595/g.145790  ORF Transcript_104595/g.145790 Transcript_104595/m.145790 type:complete len:319 (+) Transcript_104595:147-1103(+)
MCNLQGPAPVGIAKLLRDAGRSFDRHAATEVPSDSQDHSSGSVQVRFGLLLGQVLRLCCASPLSLCAGDVLPRRGLEPFSRSLPRGDLGRAGVLHLGHPSVALHRGVIHSLAGSPAAGAPHHLLCLHACADVRPARLRLRHPPSARLPCLQCCMPGHCQCTSDPQPHPDLSAEVVYANGGYGDLGFDTRLPGLCARLLPSVRGCSSCGARRPSCGCYGAEPGGFGVLRFCHHQDSLAYIRPAGGLTRVPRKPLHEGCGGLVRRLGGWPAENARTPPTRGVKPIELAAVLPTCGSLHAASPCTGAARDILRSALQFATL